MNLDGQYCLKVYSYMSSIAVNVVGHDMWTPYKLVEADGTW